MNNLLNKCRTSPLQMSEVKDKKLLINTINAHSFNIAREEKEFYDALDKSDILLPDGVSIVLAVRLLSGKRLKKISGYDLFLAEMEQLNSSAGRCFFLGSSTAVLSLIENRAKREYPNVEMRFFSPPFVPSFSFEENDSMINAIKDFSPDVLFVGMTAPKQEKWASTHFDELDARHICSIGAVFDFYAGTVKRAPQWMIKLGLEWFYRFAREPKRLWRRYLLGNSKFLTWVLKEKLKMNKYKATIV
jgi:N-acetylglucosaminyldiphosphoundecaprenol N-acetyl-beta-D-mannosaminyltransferase